MQGVWGAREQDKLATSTPPSPAPRDGTDTVSFVCGAASRRGSAHSRNEDRFVCAERLGLVAVMDGHGGEAAAEFLQTHLVQAVTQALAEGADEKEAACDAERNQPQDAPAAEPQYWQEGDVGDVAPTPTAKPGTEMAMRNAVLQLEQEFLAWAAEHRDDSGACIALSMALPASDQVVTSWCGDTRAVLYDAKAQTARQLTRDHTAANPTERDRLMSAHVKVRNGRVLGVLEPSRAVGDLNLKRLNPRAVVAECECNTVTVDLGGQGGGTSGGGDPSFLILATDGVWEGLSCQSACDVVLDALRQQPDTGQQGQEQRRLAAQAAAEEITSQARLSSQDDCTTVVMLLGQ